MGTSSCDAGIVLSTYIYNTGVYMKVAFSDNVGLDLVLDGCWPRPRVACSSVHVARRGLTNLSRVKRGDIL